MRLDEWGDQSFKMTLINEPHSKVYFRGMDTHLISSGVSPFLCSAKSWAMPTRDSRQQTVGIRAFSKQALISQSWTLPAQKRTHRLHSQGFNKDDAIVEANGLSKLSQDGHERWILTKNVDWSLDVMASQMHAFIHSGNSEPLHSDTLQMTPHVHASMAIGPSFYHPNDS